jgi:hypothetical protein
LVASLNPRLAIRPEVAGIGPELACFSGMTHAPISPLAPPDGYFDEMLCSDGSVRLPYRDYARWLAQYPAESMAKKRDEADLIFRRTGITLRFTAKMVALSGSFPRMWCHASFRGMNGHF